MCSGPLSHLPHHLYVFPQGQPDVGTDAKLARFQRRDLEILCPAVPELEPIEKSEPHVTPLLFRFLPLRHEPASTSTTITPNIYRIVSQIQMACTPRFSIPVPFRRHGRRSPITRPDIDSIPTGDRSKKLTKFSSKDIQSTSPSPSAPVSSWANSPLCAWHVSPGQFFLEVPPYTTPERDSYPARQRWPTFKTVC